ncbi:MAG: hypothetical protein RL407_1979 [Bacteroidota bacterium]
MDLFSIYGNPRQKLTFSTEFENDPHLSKLGKLP